MDPRKFIYVIFGQQAEVISQSLKVKMGDCEEILSSPLLVAFENQVYDTGLPATPVRHNDVTLHFHGIIFPQKHSLDHFAQNRRVVLEEMISHHRKELCKIPYSIANGSFVGFAVDHASEKMYAFTSFLNSIPFYYAKVENCLLLCTDLEILAKSINLQYKLNDGVYEYYANGTNLSEMTAFPEIKCVPKGGCLNTRRV